MGGSQLLLRHRCAYGPDWTSRLVFGRLPLEVVSSVMSRKMMLNINRLADRETGRSSRQAGPESWLSALGVVAR
jgi:hypothetical protein